ncbi:restriction endonuclease subunit S [Marmoricola sp. URHB0036]|uniref:restriction endonuclease subunit S n=1 Tax=Marmoricola sp. URHB0036 TaxID=1298863 RepID=UPI0006872D90|nr:restriction endonuclease subunit S [Marmoricola sp. URHB0036]
MSLVDDLVSNLASDSVQYKDVGEIASYVRGVTYSKVDEEAGGDIRVLRANNITLSSNTLNFGDVKEVSGSVRVRPDQRLQADDILISVASGSKSHVGKVAYVEKDVDYYFGGFMAVLRVKSGVDSRFLFHALLSTRFSRYLEGALSSTTINNLNAKTMGAFRVPVPRLEVQRSIVKILDQFTELEAELAAELQLRKRQRVALTRSLPYAGQIRKLSPDGVKRVRIGDVATKSSEALRVQPDESYVNLGVRWYGEGAFARGSKAGSAIKGSTLYRVKAGQFIYNRMFVVEGSFGIITPDLAGGVVSSEFPVYDLDETRVLPGWLLLYLLDEYTLKRVAAEVTGVERGTMKSRRRWKEEQFEAFEIELPSVAAQQEILRVLGAGVALESALQDELVARRKQCGHYRDRLLMFDEVPA